jgi:hypothetical protein
LVSLSTRLGRDRAGVATQPARDWRLIVFRGVAGLLALALGGFTSLFLLAPWTLVGPTPDGYVAELHRWHHADIGAFMTILFAGSLLALLVDPRGRAVLGQFALVAIGVLGVTSVIQGEPGPILPTVVVSSLLIATFPSCRALFSFERAGPVSVPLLAVAIGATIPLLINAYDNFKLQANDHSQHATEHHWNGSTVVAIVLLVAGYLVASRRPGWSVLGLLLGAAYLYLGIAALTIPDHDGSWGVRGGLLALVAGAAFVVATVVEVRRANASPNQARSLSGAPTLAP